MQNGNNHVEYPEYETDGRACLAYAWIPPKTNVCLDVGCAWGYSTAYFKKKCSVVVGMDPNEEYMKIAKKRHLLTGFVQSYMENAPFSANSFDVIILNNVLEHVADEKKSLDECHRILRQGGTLIITVPHKGLFSFMDPFNIILYVKTNANFLYMLIYRALKGTDKEIVAPGLEHRHEHYSKNDLIALLDKSKFHGKYLVAKCFRSGLFIGLLGELLDVFFSNTLGKKLGSAIAKPVYLLGDLDFRISYGPLSYNIALKVIKKA